MSDGFDFFANGGNFDGGFFGSNNDFSSGMSDSSSGFNNDFTSGMSDASSGVNNDFSSAMSDSSSGVNNDFSSVMSDSSSGYNHDAFGDTSSHFGTSAASNAFFGVNSNNSVDTNNNPNAKAFDSSVLTGQERMYGPLADDLVNVGQDIFNGVGDAVNTALDTTAKAAGTVTDTVAGAVRVSVETAGNAANFIGNTIFDTLYTIIFDIDNGFKPNSSDNGNNAASNPDQSNQTNGFESNSSDNGNNAASNPDQSNQTSSTKHYDPYKLFKYF